MEMSHTRKQRETSFHDELFGAHDDARKAATKYYTIREPAHSFYRGLVSLHCRGRRLLEYGCGTGSDAPFFVQSGATVTGIDISSAGITKAREHALREGVNVDYHVMDAENLHFADRSFDIVVGGGILHHLNLQASYAELSRVLAEDGHAVFIEPLGHNPLINLYRKYTPSMRTVDEHPLIMADIQLARRYFGTVEARFFILFTLLAVPFRNMRPAFAVLVRFLNMIDRVVFAAFPFTRKYAWMVVLHLSRPRKERR